MRRGRRRATRQGAPAKAWFATVAKPSSSTRRASSRWAIRSDGGSSRSTVPHAEAVHPAATGRHEQRAALAEQPDAQLAVLERKPGLALELALLVAEQVAEQALCHRLSREDRACRLVRAWPLRPDHARASERVQLRDDPGVRQRGQRDRGGQRLEPDHPHARADERHRVQERPGMPDPSPAAQPARISGLAPRDRGELGKGLVCAHPPAIGRRMITRSASRGSSRTCVALPGPSGTVPM